MRTTANREFMVIDTYFTELYRLAAAHEDDTLVLTGSYGPALPGMMVTVAAAIYRLPTTMTPTTPQVSRDVFLSFLPRESELTDEEPSEAVIELTENHAEESASYAAIRYNNVEDTTQQLGLELARHAFT